MNFAGKGAGDGSVREYARAGSGGGQDAFRRRARGGSATRAPAGRRLWGRPCAGTSTRPSSSSWPPRSPGRTTGRASTASSGSGRSGSPPARYAQCRSTSTPPTPGRRRPRTERRSARWLRRIAPRRPARGGRCSRPGSSRPLTIHWLGDLLLDLVAPGIRGGFRFGRPVAARLALCDGLPGCRTRRRAQT